MGDEQQKKAKTSVWWDLNNCDEVPKEKGIDARSIVSNIPAALLKAGYEGPVSIHIYGNMHKLPTRDMKTLRDSKITEMLHYPDIEEDPHYMLKKMLINWAYDNLPSCNIMIISDDLRMTQVLARLKSMEVNVLLAHTSHAPKVLLDQAPADNVWLLDTILAPGKQDNPVASVDDNHVDGDHGSHNSDLTPTCLQHPLMLFQQQGKRIILINHVRRLSYATHEIIGCKVIGLDCQWIPKGSGKKGASVMQIATGENRVFVFDFMKLYNEAPVDLDSCLNSIFCSPHIIKVGCRFLNDIRKLALAYGDFNCFKQFENLLDLQNLFQEHRGRGLSSLAKEVLEEVSLDETISKINWEKRPLTNAQLHSAFLNAAILVRIYSHFKETRTQMELESHTITLGRDPETIKKKTKNVTHARIAHKPSEIMVKKRSAWSKNIAVGI